MKCLEALEWNFMKFKIFLLYTLKIPFFYHILLLIKVTKIITKFNVNNKLFFVLLNLELLGADFNEGLAIGKL